MRSFPASRGAQEFLHGMKLSEAVERDLAALLGGAQEKDMGNRAAARALEEARKALGLAPASEAPKRMAAGAIEGLLVHPAPRAPPCCAMLRRAG